MISKRFLQSCGIAAVFLVTTGCLELDVTNKNQPDRARALAEPGDLEALVAGTFGAYFDAMHNGSNAVNYLPNVATEFTTTTPTGRAIQAQTEPRTSYNVALSIGSTGEHGPRDVWRALNEIAGSSHDGLRTIADGVVIREGGQDVTPRALAFGKLMQGWVWGYQATQYDVALVVSEDESVPGDAAEFGRERLIPYQQGLERALDAIDEAIQIAQQNSFIIPDEATSRIWFASPDTWTNEEFVQLANTVAARLLVLNARNPQERTQVDWGRVLQYTSNGLTKDLETRLASGFRTSLLLGRSQGNPAGCANCFRVDPRLIGWADTSGAYQAWMSAHIDDRDRYDVVTPDRRITGPTPTSDGAYFRYRSDNNGFTGFRYLFSAYQWARHAHSVGAASQASGNNQGAAKLVTADENNLLRAEALLRTGDLEGAANLINITRTRSHTLPDGQTYGGLPPVTADGVPQSADCVPRTDDGACGDLMVALRYERMIELMALDLARGFLDSRGFGILPDGTWLHLPPDPNELNLFGVEPYTFGGVGTEWGAVYAPVTMQDL
jgi:hypothetical protein